MLYSNINPERSYWMGADGFTWWVGQVQADGGRKLNKDGTSSEYKDETASNRVKVRIIGYHSSKFEELPVEDLPWAQVMMPAITPQSSSYGMSHQLALGSWVIGFFLDGLNCQQPIVMGVIGNIDTGEKTKVPPGSLLVENPNFPGFNNILDYRYDASNSPGGKSDSSVVSKITNGNVTFGTGFTFKYTNYSPGEESPLDKKEGAKRQSKISVANGKCSKETQQKIDETFGDLFRFLNTIKKVNNKYINKYTGEIVDFTTKIQGFVGRVFNIVSDILGSIKVLITNFIRQLVRNLINSILTPNAFCLDVAKELGDALLNSILCLIDNILQTLIGFIENIILALIENVINAAFCLVQSVINSLMESITSAVSGALQAITNITSLIASGGDLISNLASQIAGFISSLCGGFGCEIEADRYDVDLGEFLPKSLFGSFGAGQTEAFINTDFLNIDSPRIFDSEGNLVSGSLNCSPDNLALLSCPPKIILTGLQRTAIPPRITAIVDNSGRLISTLIRDPGFNINSTVNAIVSSCNGFGGGAVIRPAIENGQLQNIIIDNPGFGFPNFDRTADNINENLVIPADSPNFVGSIIGTNVVNAGNGYGDDTRIIINDNFVITNPEIVDGQIISVPINAIIDSRTQRPVDSLKINSFPDVQILGSGNGARIIPILKFVPIEQAETLINNYNTSVEIIDCPGHPNGN